MPSFIARMYVNENVEVSDRDNDREDRDKVLSNNNLKTEEILKIDREDRDDDRDDDRIAEVVLLIIPKQMIPIVH